MVWLSIPLNYQEVLEEILPKENQYYYRTRIHYTCQNCGKKFISSSKLKIHTSDVHEKLKIKNHMFHNNINQVKHEISSENKENIEANKPFIQILKDSTNRQIIGRKKKHCNKIVKDKLCAKSKKKLSKWSNSDIVRDILNRIPRVTLKEYIKICLKKSAKNAQIHSLYI